MTRPTMSKMDGMSTSDYMGEHHSPFSFEAVSPDNGSGNSDTDSLDAFLSSNGGGQSMLLGMYAPSFGEFDFEETMQSLPPSSGSSPSPSPYPHNTPPPTASGPFPVFSSQQGYYSSNAPMQTYGEPSPTFSIGKGLDSVSFDMKREPMNTSPTSSSSSKAMNDAGKDSEEILKAPVKSLTEHEKKLRRRAQVAKSARKHRNRQKEELAQLREQVQMLQDQMARMHNSSPNMTAETIKQEEEEITQRRKRKKGLDTSTDYACASPSLKSTAADEDGNLGPHCYHQLPVDPASRASTIRSIADARMDRAIKAVRATIGRHDVSFPHMDIKLNSNGPDLEIQIMRGRFLPGLTHQQVGDASWNTVFSFLLDIPKKFQKYCRAEKLVEVDENTRYGRTVTPIMRNSETKEVVYMHSYLIVRRRVTENYTCFTWESVAADALYPSEPSRTLLMNQEMGCTLLETEYLPDGSVQTLFRAMNNATPPANAIAEPRGKINEAFLTTFCRSAEVLEASARNLLLKRHPHYQPNL